MKSKVASIAIGWHLLGSGVRLETGERPPCSHHRHLAVGSALLSTCPMMVGCNRRRDSNGNDAGSFVARSLRFLPQAHPITLSQDRCRVGPIVEFPSRYIMSG